MRMLQEDKTFLIGFGLGVALGIAILLVLAFWNLAV